MRFVAASVTHGLQAPQQAVGAALLHLFITLVSLYVSRRTSDTSYTPGIAPVCRADQPAV